jgi:hypothetical protein
MRATVQAVAGRRELLVWVAVAGLGLVSVPMRPVTGAYAGVWRAGRLVQLLPAAEGLALAERGLAALPVDAGHLDEL